MCKCPARSPPFARPRGGRSGRGQSSGAAATWCSLLHARPPPPRHPRTLTKPLPPPLRSPPRTAPPPPLLALPCAHAPPHLRARSPPPPLAPPSIMNLRPRRAGLPQVIPQPELEAWLAKRVTFHSSNREALRTALKTYLNGGKAIVDAAGRVRCAGCVNVGRRY